MRGTSRAILNADQFNVRRRGPNRFQRHFVKTLFLVIDVLLGFAAIGFFVPLAVSMSSRDTESAKKYMRGFAICCGLLVILFAVAAIFDIHFLPSEK